MQRPNPNNTRGISRFSSVSGRISNLLNIFGDGKPHKAAELAQVIGVNSRTIRRTLHMMRDEIGIPLATSREGFQLKKVDGNDAGNEIVTLQSPEGTRSMTIPSHFWQHATTQRN